MHGVCVCDTADYFYDHIDELIDEYGLQDIKARDICDVIDGYKGEGYGKSTQEELGMNVLSIQYSSLLISWKLSRSLCATVFLLQMQQ